MQNSSVEPAAGSGGQLAEDSRRAIELAKWSSGEWNSSESSRNNADFGRRREARRGTREDEEGNDEDVEEEARWRPSGRRRARSSRVPSWPRYLFPACVSLILYLVISSLSSNNNNNNNNNNKQHNFNHFQVHAFNLDPQSAIVHAGPENSYFGYSVAQHRDRGVNYLLVGAPKAQTDQPKTVAPGAVYKCAPSNARACQQIPFDPTGAASITLKGELTQTDDKSRQFFGASLHSALENGSIVACAPAYVYFSTNLKRRDPVGTCWVSRGSFSGFLEYSPCRLNDQWGHHHMGSCQAGFSSAITKDGGRLFMGAPGSHVWQGQTFMHNLKSDLGKSTSGVNPHSEDDSYLGYSLALGRFSAAASSAASSASDTDLAIGIPRANELAGKVMLVDRDMRTLRNLTGDQVGAYFGYALAVADFNGDGLDDLAIGAPNYYNQSSSHKEAHFDRGRVYVALQDGRHEFSIVQTLEGHKNRARFGTALANCGDLNRDGLQDLAVGAPHDGPEGRGAVYIYLGRRGQPGGLSGQHDQVIFAESVGREGHLLRAFGFALSAGLDVDGNQYPDLLVGDYEASRAVLLKARPVVTAATSITFAPENFNLEDRSCVLANSSASVPCITVTYCTKYTGLNVDNKLGFVYDIKLDTENRGAAPRLFFLHQEGKSEDENTATLSKDVQQCRSFKAYIMRQIRDKLTPFKVDIDYRLAGEQPGADTYAGLDASTNQVKLRPVLSKPVNQASNQMSRTAMIQRNCGQDNICVPDLKLAMSSNLDSYTIGSNEKLVLDVTVRNQGEDAFESMFYLKMPMSINFIAINKTRADYPVCYGAKPDETGENVLSCDLGNPQARNDVLKFSVITEPARSNSLGQADFTFAAHVNSSNAEQDERHREDNRAQVGIPIRVDFQLSLSGSSQPPRWLLNQTHQQLQLTQQQLQLSTNTANAANANEQSQTQTQTVTRPSRLSEADVGPEIYHTYQLTNRGPSMINDIALTILWPTRTKDGADYLLYLVDEPETSDKVRCKPAPEGAINPLNLKYLRGNRSPMSLEAQPQAPPASSTSNSSFANSLRLFDYQFRSRNKREAAESTSSSAGSPASSPASSPAPEALAQAQTSTVDEPILQQLNLPSCGPSQCTRFECNVNNLANGEVATIKIRSRLFEDTVSKLSLQEFVISSKLIAQIKALPYNVSTQAMPPYSWPVETQILTTGIAVKDLLPWWLIVLAILIGILLFALLACFLKYLGFFDRKRAPSNKQTGAEREPLTPTIWNDYQYTPGDTAL